MRMQLASAEQLALSQGVADFLAGQFPLQRFRDNQSPDRTRWPVLAELGVFGVSMPEADGGLGLGWTDEVRVFRELGRQLVSPAAIASVLGAHLAARAGQRDLCHSLLNGQRRVGITLPQSSANAKVLEGGGDLYLLFEPPTLWLVAADANAKNLACLDDTLGLCNASISDDEVVVSEDRELLRAAPLLTAAMLCGLIEATRDMAADYARTRVQFGRPIGAFQGIKHRCADIALAAELCWSQTLHAAAALDAGAADSVFHAFAAKLLAGDEALKATRFNIQAHGGMGFTDEVDAHRLMKRAHVLQQLFGEPRQVRAKLTELDLDI